MNAPEHQDPIRPDFIRQDYDGAWKAALEKYFGAWVSLEANNNVFALPLVCTIQLITWIGKKL